MIKRVITLLAGSAMLSACISLAPERMTPESVTNLPTAYEGREPAQPYQPASWWHSFEDPVLNALVEEALRENLDIAEAAARVERASAQARIARSALFPAVNASAGAQYSDSPLAGSAFGGFAGGAGRLQNESYTLSLGASYELDLFGRVRNDMLAARADAVAAEHDFRSVQLAAAAETISAYFDIVDGRRQIELTLLTADLLGDRTERTEDRFRSGLVESFELYQVRQDLRTTQSSLPSREAALGAVEGRLALLLRDYPGELKPKISGPLRPRLVFDPVPTGLPAELLGQRPDVAAAWNRMEAARLRIGARRAERFPALSLSASIGTQGDTPGSAFDVGQNWGLSLASNIVAPIIDGGRISANIRAARAAYDESAAAYARAVINGYREVAAAIEDYEETRQRYRLIQSQLVEAEASADLQARRYRAGIGGYIAYLDALRGSYQVQASLSTAGRDVALARLGLHRALGGDWSDGITFTPVAMTGSPEKQDLEGDRR